MAFKHVEKARARLKEIDGALKAFEDKETLTAEDIAEVKKLTTEASEVETTIKDLESAEQVRAKAAAPANEHVDHPAEVRDGGKLDTKQKIGILCASMVRAKAEDGNVGRRSVFRMMDEMGYGSVAREFDATRRTLTSGSASGGGITIPETMNPDVIDLLRPNATFLQGNPIPISMPNGTYKQPAAASGATASYRGETKAASVTQPTFRAINMSAKLLSAIVPLSNQLVRYNPNIQGWVENDLSLAMGTAMDLAAFRGDGTGDAPLGITRIAGVLRQACATATTTTPTAAAMESDIKILELRMENANLPLVRVEWRMAPRTIKYLQNLRDANSNRIYPELQGPNPTWRNYPVRVTTQIPTNLGTGTDESEIYLVAFGHVLFGDTLAMQLAISDSATVVNGSQTINAFQDGVTLIKAEAEHDFDIRYAEAVAVLTGVKWGG